MTLPDITTLNLPTLIVFAALALMSGMSVTVCAFKTLQFNRMGVGRVRRAEAILETWLGGDADRAMQDAASGRSVLARVLQSVFSGLHAKPGAPEFAEELARQTAMVELNAM